MRVKALKRFYDLQSKALRLEGDEFTTNQERAEALVSSSFCVLVEVVEEKKPAKRSRKKAGE